MWKLVARACCFLSIQIAIGLPVILCGYRDRPRGYLAALEDKLSMLAAPGDKRLIFVGGSSTAFGIDSALFRRSLGLETINFGLHGALGLDIYLRMVEEHARGGDVVLLIPEWHMIRGGLLEIAPNFVNRIVREQPTALRYMGGNLPALKSCADNLALAELAFWSQHAVRTWWRNLRGAALDGGARAANRSNVARVYRRESFNAFGDMVGHHGLPAHKERIAEQVGRLGAPRSWKPPGPHTDRVIARINRFTRHCKQRGAHVVLSYPPSMQQYYERFGESMERTRRYLESRLDAPVLTAPADNVFSEDHFFDDMGHLNASGKAARSSILLRDLSRHLERLAPPPAETPRGATRISQDEVDLNDPVRLQSAVHAAR